MIKPIKIGVSFLVLVLSIAAGIYYYLTIERRLELSGEQEMYSARATIGKFWTIITSDKGRARFMEKYNVTLPQNDFENSYLLVSDGRRIKELRYRLISRYQWEYPFPMGVEVFDKTHDLHSIFIYRIKKVYIHQSSD